MTRVIGLIPARAGSTRVPGKNVRLLSGHPLIAYTIAAARESGVLVDLVVSTDSEHYAEIARHYGAEVPFLRPAELAGSLSADFGWVEHALARLKDEGREYEAFSILRPTSPFRSAGTIRRAVHQFLDEEGIDSLRAVERCAQHPGKMWILEGRRMRPLLEGGPKHPPWHSSQYQALPEVWVQNASLEVAWTRVIFEDGTIAGRVLAPFFTEGYEGFDVNQPRDWRLAEELVATGEAKLPAVDRPPFASRE